MKLVPRWLALAFWVLTILGVGPGIACGSNAAQSGCVPGSTQACLGPGACQGAQVCASDGSSFGACDCGVGGDSGVGTDGSIGSDGAASSDGAVTSCDSGGLALCAGKCVDLTSDGHNCGSCGHDCQGGACSTGACQPVMLASGITPQVIAVDGTNVYWTSYDGSGSVWECAVGGCGGKPTQLASNQGQAGGIAVDATSVYWTTGGAVMMCPIAGCSLVPTQFVSGQDNATGIAVDTNSVYWTNASSGSTVGSVWKCTVGGCSQPTLLAQGGTYSGPTYGHPRAMTIDTANVYWFEYYAGFGTILSCAVGGCSGQPTQLASGGGDFNLNNIAVNSSGVYWAANGLLKCGVGGCNKTPIVLANTGATSIYGVAADATSVYWAGTNATTVGSCPGSGVVMSCAASGCNDSPNVLAATDCATAIAVDTKSIYWTANRLPTGSVMKLAK